MATTRKKGSGRTKGATSLIEVNLRELNRVLREDAIVMVGRKFAEALGLRMVRSAIETSLGISLHSSNRMVASLSCMKGMTS